MSNKTITITDELVNQVTTAKVGGYHTLFVVPGTVWDHEEMAVGRAVLTGDLPNGYVMVAEDFMRGPHGQLLVQDLIDDFPELVRYIAERWQVVYLAA